MVRATNATRPVTDSIDQSLIKSRYTVLCLKLTLILQLVIITKLSFRYF